MLDTVRHVETPEGVEIAVCAAGPVVRLWAWLIDEAIRASLYVAFGFVADRLGEAGLGLMLLFVFAVEWFYPVAFEVFRGGATPGKRLLRLVVVQRDGTPVGWTSSLVRNLVLTADFLPFAFGLGLASMLMDRDFRRLGDLAAGTVVTRRPAPRRAAREARAPRAVRLTRALAAGVAGVMAWTRAWPPLRARWTRRTHRTPRISPWESLAEAPPRRPPVELAPAERQAVVEFAARLPTWSAARARELAELARPLTGAGGDEGVARLAGMAAWLRGARAMAAAPCSARAAPAPAAAPCPARAALALAAAPCSARAAAADELERLLAEDEEGAGGRRRHSGAAASSGTAPLPDLYRQVCHQLALERSRRQDGAMTARLEDLVRRGHQQLYRGTGIDLGGIVPFLRGGFARRVRREGRLVAAALALFLGPALLTAAAATARPELAYAVMDAGTLESLTHQFAPGGDLAENRARAGRDVARFGGYIWNNVSIAFRTFAGGVVFGVGSAAVLVYNGVAGAAVAAHVHQRGFDRAFYAYIVGHGAFELTAIVLAGVCGLRLGVAVLAPGPLRRTRALAAACRRIVPLLYGVTAMLLVAAVLETWWSPFAAVPAALKLKVGGCLWALVLGYFALAGREHRA